MIDKNKIINTSAKLRVPANARILPKAHKKCHHLSIDGAVSHITRQQLMTFVFPEAALKSKQLQDIPFQREEKANNLSDANINDPGPQYSTNALSIRQ